MLTKPELNTRSVMGSVMGSHAGGFVEGSRLEGWKQRVAELKLDIEQRQVIGFRVLLGFRPYRMEASSPYSDSTCRNAR